MATTRGALCVTRLARAAFPVRHNAFSTLQVHVNKLNNPQNLSIKLINDRWFSTSTLLSKKFEVINIQDEQHFKKEVLDSKDPVVVDFHATWCGPCKMLAPRLESVMSKDGSMKLVKVDIDNFEDLAIKYKVRGVPAVFGFKNGKTVDSFVGLAEEDKIEGFVSKLSGQ